MHENSHKSIWHNLGVQEMAAATLAMHWRLLGSPALSFLNNWRVLGPRNSIHFRGILATKTTAFPLTLWKLCWGGASLGCWFTRQESHSLFPIWILLRAQKNYRNETMNILFSSPLSWSPFSCVFFSLVIHFTATGNRAFVQCLPNPVKINSLQYQCSVLRSGEGWETH